VCTGTSEIVGKQSGLAGQVRVAPGGNTGTLRAHSQGGGYDQCVRAHRYTMSKQSGNEWPSHAAHLRRGRVHRYTMSKQSGWNQ